MTIAILATGDELVYGDTLNTNSHAIAHALSSEGLALGQHMTCIDKEHAIVACLAFLSQHNDTLIITGGLGPTSDDRTRFALARFLSIPLMESPDALAHITTLLTIARLECNAGNRQQALFPENAVLLPNPNGTAMGCYYEANNTRFILLPGPPRECLPMFHAFVLPRLQQECHRDDRVLFKWLLFGVPEGGIAPVLDDALSHLDVETGYRLDPPYLEFKARCPADRVLTVKQCIDPLVSPYLIAAPHHKASECLRMRIDALQRPIIIRDDVTGGVLQTLLQRPSNYHVLRFNPGEIDAADGAMCFHLTGLQDYWRNETCPVTQLTIAYRGVTAEGVDTHELPYRSRLLVEYAAEWLSFRLLHLINQLHEGVA